jgi:CO/xanthine dehydrogenase Mo-binding subunit
MVENQYIDVITENYERDRPYNVKEIGEGLVPGMLSAIANAVYDATGVRVTRTPMTAEKVLEAIEKKREKKK